MTRRAGRLACHVVLAAAVLGESGCGKTAYPPSLPSALLGAKVPDFARTDLHGERVDTAKLRGRVLVVKFFAKYCEPCKRTLPAVEAVHAAHPEIALVGVDEDESAEDAREVARAYGLTFAVVHDAGNVLSGRYRVRDLPVTFVADRSGVVRWVGGPSQGEAELRAALEHAASDAQ